MSMDIIRRIEEQQMRDDLPEFRPGDTIRVYWKVLDGRKEKIQRFEGILLADKGSGVRRTITVRKISHGIGVERIFPVHSPKLVKIEVVQRGKVRHAKLYYLRDKKKLEVKKRDRFGRSSKKK